MLSNVRKICSAIHTILMDIKAVILTKTFGLEDNGSDFDEFKYLTSLDKKCFSYLKRRNLRIEQEKIP